MGSEEGNAEKQKRVRKYKVVLDHTLESSISPDAKHVNTSCSTAFLLPCYKKVITYCLDGEGGPEYFLYRGGGGGGGILSTFFLDTSPSESKEETSTKHVRG